MPWTFAHPAAVLPLHALSRRLPLSALVIGSLMPDAGYSFGLFGVARFAHGPAGALLVCVPVGALLVAFWAWLRGPIVELLPQPHRAALAARPSLPPFGDRSHGAWTLLALLLGAFTHIGWDACTHVHGFVVRAVPVLQQTVPVGPQPGIPVYKLAQHLSTLFGVVLLLWAYRRWLKRQVTQIEALPRDSEARRDDRQRWLRLAAWWLASVLGALPFAWLAAQGGVVPTPSGRSWSVFAFRVLVIAPALFALLLSVVAWQAQRRRS